MWSTRGLTTTGVYLRPRRAAAAGTFRGVLNFHTSTQVGTQAITSTTDVVPMMSKLVDHGQMIVLAGDDGGLNTWGNDTMLTATDAGWTDLKSPSGGGAKTDKCIIVGASEGGLNAINWAYRNPTQVAAMALIVPVLALQAIYVNNRNGFTASIQAAYGGGAPTYSARDPQQLASGLAGIPIKIWTASDDSNTLPAEDAAFVAAVGASCSQRDMGAVGHTYSAADPNEVLAFLAAYL